MLAVPWQHVRRARRIICGVIVLVAFVALERSAFAEQRAIAFDIPAQSLTNAIEIFSAATGQDIIYPSNLTHGRHSFGVRGEFAVEVALAKLLEDTGLSARRMSNGSLVLRPDTARPEGQTTGATARFYAHLQSGLRGAFCGNRDARPGQYRLAMRLWIDKSGRLKKYEQVGSGGSTDIDNAIKHAVTQLDLGVAPPADLEQPIVIVVLPQTAGVTMACDAEAPVPTRTVR